MFQYNIMLQATKICINCVGRLHQLFDFNLIIRNNEEQDVEVETDNCRFCAVEDSMGSEFKQIVKDAVLNTKWAEVGCENSVLSFNFPYLNLILDFC